MNRDFEPKLISVLREGYSLRQLGSDVPAGIVVGIVAFPLAIAFAIASGVRPEQGLVTAIVCGFLISALSGSRVQIGGPTGAFVVLIYSVVARHGYEGLAIATLLAGILLIGMGLARLGAVIRFVPYPVTVGFTSGIALIIATGQFQDALGLEIDAAPAEFLGRLRVYLRYLETADPMAMMLCATTILIVVFWPRVTVRLPGPLVAIVLTVAVAQLADLQVTTIGSQFGAIASALPRPRLPHFELAMVRDLVSPAITIALLGGIESLLSAVVADGMTGRRHRANAELVAQGVANIVSPFFGGIPATGAIARTATNIKNGAVTPVAGMVHAATLLVILLVAGRWAAMIPMATLAGILLVVAYNMSEWRVFLALLRGPRSDVLVLLVTFSLTVLIDLTVAIQAGVVLAALLFMRRMAEVSEVRIVTHDLSEVEPDRLIQNDDPSVPAGTEVFEVRGSFFFGSAQKFSEIIGRIESAPRVVILRMREVLAMDATGLKALEEVLVRFERLGTRLLLSGVQNQPLAVLRSSGLLARIGEDNVLDDFRGAIARARGLARGSEDAPRTAQRR